MKKIHLIMPMGGAGSRFKKEGFAVPKPLIELEGKPFLYWATESITKYVEVEDVTFVVLQEHVNEFKIDEAIKAYYPTAKVVVLPEMLNGAVLTAMEGVKHITDDLPVVFNDCDHLFYCTRFYDFVKKGEFEDLDGALLTFESDSPKYSYLKLDELGNVTETVEKKVISDQAICGAYYFRNAQLFLSCAREYLDDCEYAEYFMSGVYNVMAKKGMVIKHFTCEEHLPFGTPEEYSQAQNHNYFERLR